jgi:hypothetical protein
MFQLTYLLVSSPRHPNSPAYDQLDVHRSIEKTWTFPLPVSQSKKLRTIGGSSSSSSSINSSGGDTAQVLYCILLYRHQQT